MASELLDTIIEVNTSECRTYEEVLDALKDTPKVEGTDYTLLEAFVTLYRKLPFTLT